MQSRRMKTKRERERNFYWTQNSAAKWCEFRKAVQLWTIPFKCEYKNETRTRIVLVLLFQLVLAVLFLFVFSATRCTIFIWMWWKATKWFTTVRMRFFHPKQGVFRLFSLKISQARPKSTNKNHSWHSEKNNKLWKRYESNLEFYSQTESMLMRQCKNLFGFDVFSLCCAAMWKCKTHTHTICSVCEFENGK